MLETVSNTHYTAADSASEFLSAAKDAIERQFPEASHDTKAIAAAQMALTMALEHLSISVAGRVENSPLSAALIKFVEGDEATY